MNKRESVDHPEHYNKHPSGIECKNVESLNVWKAYAQSEQHARGTDRKPILFFKRNRSKLMVCMSADDFFKTVKESF